MNILTNIFKLCILIRLGIVAENFPALLPIRYKNRNNGDIMQAVVDIAEYCIPTSTNVILAGNLTHFWDNDVYFKLQWVYSTFDPLHGILRPSYLCNRKDIKYEQIIEGDPCTKPFRANSYIIFFNTVWYLQIVMENLDKTTWWKHTGQFLVANNMRNSCSHALDVLTITWEYDCLSVLYLCYDSRNIIWLYTLNPYSGISPEPWKQTEIFYGSYNHSGALYRRKYTPLNPYLIYAECKNLFYDKTTILDGYPVKISIVKYPVILEINETLQGLSRYQGLSGKAGEVLWSSLNVSPIVTEYEYFATQNSQSSYMSYIRYIISGKADIGMNVEYLNDYWQMQTYPLDTSGLCIVTHRQGMVSMGEKITALVTLENCVYIFLFNIFSILVFKFVLKQSLVSAILDVLRSSFNVTALKEPKTTGVRILFISIIFTYMVTHMYIQTGISSFASLSIYKENIKTIEDLEKLNHTIYTSWHYIEQVETILSDMKILPKSIYDCNESLIAGEPAVCIEDCRVLKYLSFDHQLLHVSQQPLKPLQIAYIMRKTWPLHIRINSIIQRIQESGVSKFIELQEFQGRMLSKKRATTANFKPFTLKQLRFTFVILGVGYFCALLVFAIEIFRWRMKPSFRFTLEQKKLKKIYLSRR